MATLVGQDSSGNLKVEVEPNEANTYLPNDYTPTKAEIEDITDDIDDLETAVSALKTAVEAFPVIEVGTTESTTSVTGGSYADIEITFTKTFANAPKVFTNMTGSGDTSYRGAMSAFVTVVSTTAATIRVYNNSAATISVGFQWLAIS